MRSPAGGRSSTSCAAPTASCCAASRGGLINHLSWQGVPRARELLQEFAPLGEAGDTADDNRPARRSTLADLAVLSQKAFQIVEDNQTEDEMVAMHPAVDQGGQGQLPARGPGEPEHLADRDRRGRQRYEHLGVDDSDLPQAVRTAMRVALLRRFLTDQLEFINVAKNCVEVDDFYALVRHTICPSKQPRQARRQERGAVPRRAASSRRSHASADVLQGIRVPKTWYVTSDGLLEFIRYNNLEDLYDRKYMEIEQVRQEYPHIVQVFKNSPLSAGDRPRAVGGARRLRGPPAHRAQLEPARGPRRRGLLREVQEPVPRQPGPRRERLGALPDAIAEVYASIFGPDPIEYRAERGLLDVHEEMGIMIQEVVGRRVGHYFLPAFAGVAFSNNEFRWSPRIRREDGLVRLVPGLGTRAVDRLSRRLPDPGRPGTAGPAGQRHARRDRALLAAS